MIHTLAELVKRTVDQNPDAIALRYKGSTLRYSEFFRQAENFAAGLAKLGLNRWDRLAILSGKSLENVVAIFGTSMAGGVFVPVNPLLKASQICYILEDCNVRILVTVRSRLPELADAIPLCPDLAAIVVIDGCDPTVVIPGVECVDWNWLTSSNQAAKLPGAIPTDIAAILYTSGSTGRPKGVVLSHANMAIGAQSVASYLDNNIEDNILAVLPLSFDAGLSQLTTGFCCGATVVLHDYLLPRDVVNIVGAERITGITGVPPLWIQLSGLDWPRDHGSQMRYFANTGGKMPRDTLRRLRKIFPQAKPYLMYGLTESFRSTYLPPEEIDRRPDSIGKAIPNVEVMVIDADGHVCAPGAEGELVHRGPLVSLGYWNDRERTAERFKPVPGLPDALPNPELAVWSGDTVRLDEDGYLYFVGRKDDMIKTSGYRVSPTEIEEVAYETGLVSEVAAIGIAHDQLGQAIILVAKPKISGQMPSEELLAKIRPDVPNYMVPLSIMWKDRLPRNANGKLDRPAMAREFADLFQDLSTE